MRLKLSKRDVIEVLLTGTIHVIAIYLAAFGLTRLFLHFGQ